MDGCGTVSGVIATVQPLSFHLITFSRMAGRGRQDVAVTGAITVGDETLRRFLNRVEIGLDGASTAGASAGLLSRSLSRLSISSSSRSRSWRLRLATWSRTQAPASRVGRGRNFYLRDQARGKTPCPPISRCAYSQPTTPAQVKRVVIQAYGYYARLGGRTAQVVALVKKLFDEAGAAIEVVEGSPLE